LVALSTLATGGVLVSLFQGSQTVVSPQVIHGNPTVIDYSVFWIVMAVVFSVAVIAQIYVLSSSLKSTAADKKQRIQETISNAGPTMMATGLLVSIIAVVFVAVHVVFIRMLGVGLAIGMLISIPAAQLVISSTVLKFISPLPSTD
jgi:hypothetical protein